MKTAILHFCLMLGFPGLGFGQSLYFSLASHGTNTISIPSGEVWQLISYRWSPAGMSSSDYQGMRIMASTNIESQISILRDGWELINLDSYSKSSGAVFVGPLFFQSTGNPGDYILFFKKLTDDGNDSVSANAVVIPSSATGDVDIKLEQSADNVTWTECLPGTYNSSTVKRFFRLRAVEK